GSLDWRYPTIANKLRAGTGVKPPPSSRCKKASCRLTRASSVPITGTRKPSAAGSVARLGPGGFWVLRVVPDVSDRALPNQPPLAEIVPPCREYNGWGGGGRETNFLHESVGTPACTVQRGLQVPLSQT